MKKEEFVFQVFESISDDYDAANNRISLGLHMHWKRSAVERLLRGVPQGGRVLDLCCGTGDMTELMLSLRPDIRVVGLDFSPAMLAQAEKRLGALRGFELVLGNAMALPFNTESFDGAVISFALRNTADYGKVLEEMARVTRTGAPVCCIDSFVPECAFVRPFYQIYFSLMMPLLGGGRKKRTEYRWLCRSTREYVSPEELRQLMAEYGLTDAERQRFMFGSCVSLCTYKEGKPR